MSKTWETLFNLSSFMKYLLTEVLPDEKVESPSYVLDSLYDLLSVTVALIDKIKSVPHDCMRTRNNLAERSAEAILSSRTNLGIGSNVEKNIMKTDSSTVSKFLENKLSLTPKSLSKEEPVYDKLTNLESTSKPVSEEFRKLSNEMHNGRPFGHYCRPCDIAIFSKKIWDKHNSDKLHIFLKENCENKYASCSYCNLIIFATFAEADHLFNHHQKQHLMAQNVSQNLNSTDNTLKTDYKILDNIKCTETKYDATSSDRIVVGVNDFEASPVPEVKQNISPVFIDIDKLMHSGNETGFYCHTCDKTFDVVTQWNKHFQDDRAHVNQVDNSECFEMCEYCKLVIFATPSIQKIYKAYHLRSHKGNRCDEKVIKSKSSSLKTSMENIYLMPPDQSNQGSLSFHENKGFSNRISSKTYNIIDEFKNFNAKIHFANLCGYFYCRPCNACLNPEEWIKHSSVKKHLQLMGSRKFINWKGTCAYCSFTIVGTRETVKYYMEYHNTNHQRVLSYDEEKINPTYKTNYMRGRLRTRNRGMSPSNSVSTLGGDDEDEETSDYENETDETENKSACIDEYIKRNEVINFFTSDGNTESSWYSSSREEQLHFLVFKLVNSRLEQKQKSGTVEFGALCMVCESTFENAFHWEDHLKNEDHCLRISSRDRKAVINDLNIVLFGNCDILEKYKTLVKGNMTFIES